MTRGLVAAALCGFVAAGPLAAVQQEPAFRTLDRIVAVVGTRPIVYTNLVEEINTLRQAGAIGEIPTDPAALADLERRVLDQLIDEELLVQQAQRDTLVTVSEERVQASVEQAIREVRNQFASDLEYRRELRRAGFGTPEDYRRYFTERRRREMLQQTLIQSLQQRSIIRAVPPTQHEMRAYFDENQSRFPARPASVSFRQIIVRPEASPAAVETARALADSLHRALTGGADFAAVARRFSDDPATAQQGGQLGWFRRGQMVPEFERFAFNLRPGVLSPVFRSPFGFHILQVQRIEPSEVQGRHVLIAPEVTDADREAARARADSIAQALRQGTPFDSLHRRYHDQLDQSLFDEVSQADLWQSVQQGIAEAEPGDVVGPIDVIEGGPARFAVVRFLDRKPAGAYTFEEMQESIRRRLSEESGIRRHLQMLREQVYVDIRL